MKTILLLLVIFSFKLHAHPVIYKDGYAISSFNMSQISNNYVMYSFKQNWSLGLDQWRFSRNNDNNELGLLKLNHLLWRKNTENSQANIYLHTGFGVEDQEIQSRQTRANFMGGVEADWETRVLYTSAKYYQFQNTYMTQARVGFSPKEAPFNDLQTWFMVQAMTLKGIEDKLMITPMGRFFYHNVLWEVGSSTRGDWMLNLMVHY